MLQKNIQTHKLNHIHVGKQNLKLNAESIAAMLEAKRIAHNFTIKSYSVEEAFKELEK